MLWCDLTNVLLLLPCSQPPCPLLPVPLSFSLWLCPSCCSGCYGYMCGVGQFVSLYGLLGWSPLTGEDLGDGWDLCIDFSSGGKPMVFSTLHRVPRSEVIF